MRSEARKPRSRARFFGLAALLCLVGCEADDLRSRLAGASPGSEITIDAGRYEGPFEIAPGVIVRGSGEVVITVKQADNYPALVILTDYRGSTTVSNIRIESSGRAGVFVHGTGEFFGNDLVIDCQRGIGFAATQVPNVTLNNVQINGNANQAMIPQLEYPVRDTEAPTIGLVLSGVSSRAELIQVQVKGFAGFGAVLTSSQVYWRGGGVSDSVGVGVIVEGGRLESTSPLTINNIWAGTKGVGMPAFGLMLNKTQSIDVTNTTVSNVEGMGLVQLESKAIFRTLKVENSKDVGLWLQSSNGTLDLPSLKILGGSSITNNVGGGVMLVNSGGVEISDATVSGTVEREMTTDLGQEQIGDGVHGAMLTQAVTLKNVKLTNNQRAGLLLSGNPPETEKVRLTNVEITGSGKYGLLAVNGFKKEMDWDVKRDASLQQADNAFSGKFGGAAALGTLPNISLAGQLLELVKGGSSVSPAGLGN